MKGNVGFGPKSDAGTLLDAVAQRGWTIGTAESLTGGAVCAALVDLPGASRVLRGGIVAYATEIKATVLGVDAGLLAEYGAVHPEVAITMAQGVCRVLDVTVGLSVTGVAGPDPQDGQQPGTVFIAVSTPDDAVVKALHLPGDRQQVRAATCREVLHLALEYVQAR